MDVRQFVRRLFANASKLQRRALQIFAGLTVVALLTGAGMAVLAVQRLQTSYQNQRIAASTLQQAKQRQAEVGNKEQLNKEAAELLQQASQRQLRADQWVEYRINLQKTNLVRKEVNDRLRALAQTKGRFFALDSLELSVFGKDLSLFDPPTTLTTPVTMTVRGVQLISADGGKP